MDNPADILILESATFFRWIKKPVFILLGNDRRWNMEFAEGFTDVIVPVREASKEVDMCILSRCDNLIVTTGTFGRWAGLLAVRNATVLYQKDAFVKDSPLQGAFNPNLESYMPGSWIAL